MPLHDVIIIGGGLAALTAANRLSKEKNVIIFTKGSRTASNSFLAQGGVAASLSSQDHWADHYQDTMAAGCFYNDAQHVKTLVREGPDYLKKIIEQGMEFDRNRDGSFQLGKEGAHLRRRILHAGGDSTGKALTSFMLEQVIDNITLIEQEMVIDLMIENGICTGVLTLDEDNHIRQYKASATIIASGGCGAVYSLTSNDPTITGDGIAMAYRAGAELVDMEFIQFHPTMLYQQGKILGLVSEAVRGEGAFLVNDLGVRIMSDIHPLKDLAPRDVVTRQIYKEIMANRQVYLNITPVNRFEHRFPTIYKLCSDQQLDIGSGLLPVVPGSHFLMGGIKTNTSGETSIPGLYAVGEAAGTGVHGANRIASNSLLEGIVFGNRTAKKILSKQTIDLPDHLADSSYIPKKLLLSLPNKQQICNNMTLLAGVERNERDLLGLKEWLENYYHPHTSVQAADRNQAEIINMMTVSWLIATSALARQESRGAHYRSDYPVSRKSWNSKRIIRQWEEQAAVTI
ncbi:L-aspartate oxidase [Sediminibacillus albus]|uniref:L-aspartate oxidase n=1 Tax=Sediminibacillus albus TaxID=407036 RepID=A0A1G9D8L7_9BACI|nr:L-aspartate oxidase [Sediminibacillus albus]SDK60222.1 L-aspartate oxidase [Sediminibacillus albus]